VDSKCRLELFPSLREDADELKEPPFPNGPSKNFDENFFPETPRSGHERLRSGVCSLEVRIASIRTLLDVFRGSLAESLYSSLNRLTVGGDLLGVGHSF